jgi:hypothetical protein
MRGPGGFGGRRGRAATRRLNRGCWCGRRASRLAQAGGEKARQGVGGGGEGGGGRADSNTREEDS